jgi:serine/threonine-protein kinase
MRGPALAKGVAIERPQARFVLERPLGEGAMGVVWRAWRFFDPGGPRGNQAPELCAIKFLREGMAGGADAERLRGYFRNEADAMRRLNHPNVVRFIDSFEYEGTLALAMEYVDGDTFEQILARHVARARLAGGASAGALPGVPFLRALSYVEQMLGALAAAHALGIVHRDIKPSNVIVRRDGIAKLMDFGIAHLSRSTVALPAKDKGAQLVAGTGPYMSPEQVMGLAVDGRSDLYSACIVLYEMLTARTPFEVEGKSEWMIRLAHAQDPPLPLRAALPSAPPNLEGVLTRALMKLPEQRYPDTMTFGDAIRQSVALPESPGWSALKAFAADAALYRGNTAAIGEHSTRALHEMIVNKYRTMPLTAQRPAL